MLIALSLVVVIAIVLGIAALAAALVVADEIKQLAGAVVDLESRLQDLGAVLAEQTGRLNDLHLRSDLISHAVDRHAATIDTTKAELASLSAEVGHATELVKCVHADVKNDREAFEQLREQFNMLDRYIAMRDVRSGPILDALAAATNRQPVGQLQGMTVDGVQVEPTPDSVSIVSAMRDEWSERTDRLADQIRQATQRFNVANHVEAVERQAERNRVRAAAEKAEQAHLEDELAALRTGDPAFDLDEAERKAIRETLRTEKP